MERKSCSSAAVSCFLRSGLAVQIMVGTDSTQKMKDWGRGRETQYVISDGFLQIQEEWKF